MRNDAMFHDRNAFNTFTDALAILCTAAGSAFVQTREGSTLEVKYAIESESFHTPCWTYCWYKDGSSCKNKDLDIVGM